MSRSKTHIALIVAVAAALISCGGAKTSSPSADRQGGDLGQTDEQARPTRSARQQKTEPIDSDNPTAEDLRAMRTNLMGLNVPVGIATAEAQSESEAQAAALDSARVDLMRWITVQTHRFGETYAMNVPEAARKRWVERVELMSTGAARNAPVFKSAIERDRVNRTVRSHVLVVYDPVQYKQALGDAMSGNDEFNRRAQKDKLRKKMDAIISDFNSKYRR